MVNTLMDALVLLASLGCRVVGGVFFAFSTFVMKALGRLPAAQGIAAMQSINIVVLNPIFLGVFLGSAIACAVLIGWSLLNWHHPSAGWLLAGGLLYLAGSFGVMAACNVPRNNTLARLAPTSPDAGGRWAAYQSEWTRWNHIRTLASLAAAAALMLT